MLARFFAVGPPTPAAVVREKQLELGEKGNGERLWLGWAGPGRG